MKRHNYKGFGASHGVHESFRGPGSIGQHTDPGERLVNVKNRQRGRIRGRRSSF